MFIAADHGNGDQTTGQFQCGLDRMFQSLRDPVLQQQPIHHDFDGVIFPTVQRNGLVEVH